MKEIKFKIVYQHDDTRRITERLVYLGDPVPTIAGWFVVASRQYTGLHDKNGKEIFEGDILLIPDEYTDVILEDGSGPTFPDNHIEPVIFEGGCFGMEIKESMNWLYKGFISLSDLIEELGESYEIVGNIYENPELVEDK